MTRYRWRDRHDDMVRRPNPWPLRIEAGIIGCMMLAAIITGVASLIR